VPICNQYADAYAYSYGYVHAHADAYACGYGRSDPGANGYIYPDSD
jgi:hypothetical protein